jgi:hypothetical protein
VPFAFLIEEYALQITGESAANGISILAIDHKREALIEALSERLIIMLPRITEGKLSRFVQGQEQLKCATLSRRPIDS